MSNEKADTKATKQPEPIRVKRLIFGKNQIDVPGQSFVGGLDVTVHKHYAIEFLPWIRHHRVTWSPPNKETIVRYVHETAVHAWEPL
jgi:hypothetical protein